MSWQSKSTSPGLGFEILENMHSTSNQARFGRLASVMLPCKSIQVCATSSYGKFPQWNFMVVSPKNICSLSDDSILRPGAGGWCRAANLPSMPPCAQEEGCPSRSRSASRPCGLQSFTAMCSITLHLLQVLSPNFWFLSCQCGSNCKPFVPTNTELSEVRRQC